MSNFHVLKKAVDNSLCSIAVHLPTPDGENIAGIPWRGIVVLHFRQSMVPRLAADEVKDLRVGTLIEVPQTVTFSDVNLTNGQRLAEIKAVVDQMQADIADPDSDLYKEKIGIYEWYLYEGNA